MRSLKALILNATLKGSEEKSNTEALSARVQEIYEDEIVNLEIIRLADDNIAYGISPDMGVGDEWPIFLLSERHFGLAKRVAFRHSQLYVSMEVAEKQMIKDKPFIITKLAALL